AERRRESGIGRISPATQDNRPLRRFALGATRPVRAVPDPCDARAGRRGRKKPRHRGAEERGQETRGADSSSTRAPGSGATAKSVLGRLCFIPIVVRFSSLVLTVVFGPRMRSEPSLGAGETARGVLERIQSDLRASFWARRLFTRSPRWRGRAHCRGF